MTVPSKAPIAAGPALLASKMSRGGARRSGGHGADCRRCCGDEGVGALVPYALERTGRRMVTLSPGPGWRDRPPDAREHPGRAKSSATTRSSLGIRPEPARLLARRDSGPRRRRPARQVACLDLSSSARSSPIQRRANAATVWPAVPRTSRRRPGSSFSKRRCCGRRARRAARRHPPPSRGRAPRRLRRSLPLRHSSAAGHVGHTHQVGDEQQK